MQEYLEILGYTVRDKVTQFSGVASTVGFDLYGCVQVIVTPRDNGKDTPEPRWFDFSRLEKIAKQNALGSEIVLTYERVMEPVQPRSLSIAPAAGADINKPVR